MKQMSIVWSIQIKGLQVMMFFTRSYICLKINVFILYIMRISIEIYMVYQISVLLKQLSVTNCTHEYPNDRPHSPLPRCQICCLSCLRFPRAENPHSAEPLPAEDHIMQPFVHRTLTEVKRKILSLLHQLIIAYSIPELETKLEAWLQILPLQIIKLARPVFMHNCISHSVSNAD